MSKESFCYKAGCSWCCGLNTQRNSKEELIELLRKRTQLYQEMVSTEEDIKAYKEKIDEIEEWDFDPLEGEEPDLENVVRCRLLGFVDEDETKVGCLAYNTPGEKDARIPVNGSPSFIDLKGTPLANRRRWKTRENEEPQDILELVY